MSVPPALPVDATLGATAIRVDAVLRMAWTDGSVSRLTSTLGGLRAPADSVETEDGAFYSSLPSMRDVPALRQLMNGQSDSVEFQLSGLPGGLAMLADEEAHLAEGARIHVGKVFWDTDWQMVGGVRWRWLGGGGTVSLRKTAGRQTSDGVTPTTYSVALEAGTDQIRRAGASLSYWSSNQHEREHPGDLFFRLINKINIGYTKAWPRF